MRRDGSANNNGSTNTSSSGNSSGSGNGRGNGSGNGNGSGGGRKGSGGKSGGGRGGGRGGGGDGGVSSSVVAGDFSSSVRSVQELQRKVQRAKLCAGMLKVLGLEAEEGQSEVHSAMREAKVEAGRSMKSLQRRIDGLALELQAAERVNQEGMRRTDDRESDMTRRLARVEER